MAPPRRGEMSQYQESSELTRIPQMNYQFDHVLGQFYYKNQCNTIVTNGRDPCHRAGESRKPHLRVDFDRRLKLEFHGRYVSRVSRCAVPSRDWRRTGCSTAKSAQPTQEIATQFLDQGRSRLRQPKVLPSSASRRCYLGNLGLSL